MSSVKTLLSPLTGLKTNFSFSRLYFSPLVLIKNVYGLKEKMEIDFPIFPLTMHEFLTTNISLLSVRIFISTPSKKGDDSRIKFAKL